MKKNTKTHKKPIKSMTKIEVLTAAYKELTKENAELRSALSTSCVINQLMQHPEQICSVEFYVGNSEGKVAEIIAPEIGFIGTEKHPILAVRPRTGQYVTLAIDGRPMSIRRHGDVVQGPSGFELIKAKAPAGQVPPSQKIGTINFLPKRSPEPGAEPSAADDTESEPGDDK